MQSPLFATEQESSPLSSGPPARRSSKSRFADEPVVFTDLAKIAPPTSPSAVAGEPAGAAASPKIAAHRGNSARTLVGSPQNLVEDVLLYRSASLPARSIASTINSK